MCYNPSNSTYTIQRATYATSYIGALHHLEQEQLTERMLLQQWIGTILIRERQILPLKDIIHRARGPFSDPLTVIINHCPGIMLLSLQEQQHCAKIVIVPIIQQA